MASTKNTLPKFLAWDRILRAIYVVIVVNRVEKRKRNTALEVKFIAII